MKFNPKNGKKRNSRVKIPGFVKEEIGLGDVIKKATSYIGVKTCGGCQKRAESLNQRVVFAPRSDG